MKFHGYIVALLVTALYACSSQVQDAEQDNALLEKFSIAMASSETSVIESAIHEIEVRIATGRSAIKNLEYSKAQLLFRLGKSEEALRALGNGTKSSLDLYVGTLYLRLHRTQDAKRIFDQMIESDKSALVKPGLSSERRLELVKSMLIVANLENKDVNLLVNGLVGDKLLTPDQATQLNMDPVDTVAIVKSMWPD